MLTLACAAKGDIRYVRVRIYLWHWPTHLINSHKRSQLTHLTRRLARRGGVKRISSDIYDSVRSAMKRHLEEVCSHLARNTGPQLEPHWQYKILRDCCALVDHQKRKTCTVTDVSHPEFPNWLLWFVIWRMVTDEVTKVIFALRRIGRPIYGFDKDTYTEKKGRR